MSSETMEKQAERSSEHLPTKITDIFLEDERLTLWRPSQNDHQHCLIPATLPEGDLSAILQTYYTRFDCVTSSLTFDDAVPIIGEQRTTLSPTDDFTILRDYPRIQGLWFKPDFEDKLGPEEHHTVGNLKLSISLSKLEKESMFTQLNVYFLEVLDYPSEDKSVSRILLSKAVHEKFPKYDIFKPGGPIHVIRHVDQFQGELEVHFLRMSFNCIGQRWRHEVEFMIEDDPWPLCRIIPHNNRINRRQFSAAEARELGISIPTRYVGATWKETLAGLFIWAMQTHLVWLVFERLHFRVKDALNKCVKDIEETEALFSECPLVCPDMFYTYEHLDNFINKCENEVDLKSLLNIFLSLHSCNEECNLVTLTSMKSSKVLHGILVLLEKIIACSSPQYRYQVTSTILPWAVMGHQSTNRKLKSFRKMVTFIGQTEGINTDLHLDVNRLTSPELGMNGSIRSSGYDSSLSSYRTPRSPRTTTYRQPMNVSRDSESAFEFRDSIERC